MSSQNASVSRPLVGGIALGCLAAAVGLWVVQTRTTQDGAGLQMWIAAFVRVGMLMSAFWLALPALQGKRFHGLISTEMVIGFVVAALALARLQLRVLIPLFVLLAIAAMLLRPRPKDRPPRRS